MSDAPTSSLMTRLRDETREAHNIAESGQLEQSLVHGTLPRTMFVRYLEQRLIAHRALEQGVADWTTGDGRTSGLVLPEQVQTPNLLADLNSFGVEVERIRPLPATERFVQFVQGVSRTCHCAILGAFYVLEGSKNGARYIARAISRAYELRDGVGLRYLDPHGERQTALWQEFKVRVNTIAFTPDECDAIVAAARDTFAAIHEMDSELWATAHVAPSAAVVGGP